VKVEDFLRFWGEIPGVDQLTHQEDETNLMRPTRRPTPPTIGNTPATTLWARPHVRQAERATSYPLLPGATCWMARRSARSASNRLTQILECGLAMQEMRRLHAAGRGGEVDICSRCCTTIPHPLLVTGSLLMHGRTVRRLIPLVERLSYLFEAPRQAAAPHRRPQRTATVRAIAT